VQPNNNYPSRCFGRHTPIAHVVVGEASLIRGRVIQLSGRDGVLADETGQIRFQMGAGHNLVSGKGDIVELQGILGKVNHFEIREIRLLSRSVRNYEQGDWLRFHANERECIKNLRMRAKVLSAIRSFFTQRDFIEVETPYMLDAPGQEVHIEPFITEYRNSRIATTHYLATSPEHHMKRMLGGGLEQIFQIARCFRNDEFTDWHNPEFTMVEWYRAYANYEDIMADTEDLIAHVTLEICGKNPPARLAGIAANKPWQKISVYDAFERWADIDLSECTDADTLFNCARRVGFASAAEGDTWDDLFHKILLEKIEPQLAKFAAVFLIDYPAPLAALAKRKESNGAVAERAEAYIGGVELANGYTELNDPHEQRQRFEDARKNKGSGEPLDEGFLRAMECAIPPAGGMALGVDRLVMLLAGSEKIGEVIAFPYLS
jgi:lysyl-tRNA synthetase class 2